jgi:NAD dependent epimerase/dehydratase
MAKVLVTGADGFIGSHLTEQLVEAGHEVRALVQYNSFNSWGWLDGSPVAGQLEVQAGDVRDPGFCRKAAKGVDTIYNLAALIAIPYSYAAPDSYVDTNVKGALNICQAALETGARVLQVSTSEVYGTARYVPIDEKHPLQPQSPYSASKIGADAMAMSFHAAFELPVTIARPFNTYGPRQSARAVIPTIITQIAGGARQIKLGDTSPTRDFNFVADTCRGMRALAGCAAAVGQTVNIGSNAEISVGDTLEMIREIMGREVEFLQDPERLRPAGSEVFRLWADNSLMRELTGWSPKVGLREGLSRTVDWFTDPANLSRYKADVYNV